MADRSGPGAPGIRRVRRSSAGAALWTGLLVLVAFLWGISFIAIKYAIEYVTPLELVAMRYVPVALTFAVMLVPTRRRQVWHLVRTDGWRVALIGLGGVLYNVSLGLGETRVAAGTASLIIALNPAFTYVLAVVFLGERFTRRQVLGLTVAFGGLFVIVRWGSGRPVTVDDARYVLITLLAPAWWAVNNVVGKALVARHPPLLVSGVSMMFAGLFSLAFVRPSFVAQLPSLPTAFWWVVLSLAWLCTVFALSVWFGAMEHMPAGRVAGFVYLIPMFAVAFSHLLLDEPIPPALVIGAAILVGGVWLINR